MTWTWSRRWHLLTAIVVGAALVLQLALVVSGAAVLVQDEPPGLLERIYRFFAYFTIQSNLLIAYAAITLARDPFRDGGSWRALRLAGIVGITVTGLVHFFLLRPLLDLHGLSYLADKLLHMAVPVLAVIGWFVFGPRPRVTGRVVGCAILFPVLWLAWTLTWGELDGWYPYPFIDPGEKGWPSVLGTCAAITVLFVGLILAAQAYDGRARVRDTAPAPD